jgi:hypothetical protein
MRDLEARDFQAPTGANRQVAKTPWSFAVLGAFVSLWLVRLKKNRLDKYRRHGNVRIVAEPTACGS